MALQSIYAEKDLEEPRGQGFRLFAGMLGADTRMHGRIAHSQGVREEEQTISGWTSAAARNGGSRSSIAR